MKIFRKIFRTRAKRTAGKKKLTGSRNSSKRRIHATKTYGGPPHLPRDDFLFGGAGGGSSSKNRRRHRVRP